MNTQSQKGLKGNTINPWDDLLAFKNYNQEIEHDSQMLMFSFLGEVEKFQSLQNINKKSLAEKIKTSASYITQLFRGNKPLNFETIAKVQKVLKIKFKISAVPIENTSISMDIHKISVTSNNFIFGQQASGSNLYTVKGGKYNETSLLEKFS